VRGELDSPGEAPQAPERADEQRRDVEVLFSVFRRVSGTMPLSPDECAIAPRSALAALARIPSPKK
jgi:hypothetical protein